MIYRRKCLKDADAKSIAHRNNANVSATKNRAIYIVHVKMAAKMNLMFLQTQNKKNIHF